jgi:dienelactone hydrolase
MNALRLSAILRVLATVLAVCLTIGRGAQAQEVVSFASLDGDLTGGTPTSLRGLLFKPAGSGPFPAVVGMHGCGGLFNKQGQLVAREAAWAEILTSRGYVVLFPDSFGPRNVVHACAYGISDARPWAERSDDAYGALRYLQSQPFVIGERIGLIGWSHGGGTVAFAVDRSSKTRPATLPKGDFRAAVAFYPGWCSALGKNWTTAIPFLLEIGASDDWTVAAPCVKRVKSAMNRGAPMRMMVYAGAFHDFDWPGMTLHITTPRPGKTVHTGMNPEARADAVARVPAFLDEYLKP